MAEQFLRIGGRSEDGFAKPLQTDNDGNLLTAHSKRMFNVDLRSQKNHIKNNVYDVDGARVEVFKTFNPCVVESIVFTFEDNISPYFKFALGNEVGSLEYFRAYRPSIGSYTSDIRPIILDVATGKGYSNEFELVLFDEENDIYIVRNRFPIYAPNGVDIGLNSNSNTKVACSYKIREAR